MLILLDIEAMIKARTSGWWTDGTWQAGPGIRPGDWQGERLLAGFAP